MQKLYTWGANSHGQLALGNLVDVTSPHLASLSFKPELIVAGGRHTILTEEGKDWYYVCGCNDHQQLGVNSPDPEVQVPLAAKLCGTVKKAAAGWDFSLVVLDDGTLHCWGINSHGQLSCGNSQQTAKEPTLISGVADVQNVSAGLRHSIIATHDGQVLTSGCNKRGQLGDAAVTRRDAFGAVVVPAGITRVISTVAGSHHSALLTESGQVVVWGCNRYGQLCQDPASCHQVNDPTILDQRLFDNERIVQVTSGWTHMLALTSSGRLLSWGRNNYGQLGRPCDQQWTPAPVLSPVTGVRSVACGSEHNLALTEGGDVYSWGWNEHGMCGQGHEVNVLQPTRVTCLSNIEAIACGAGHSIALAR